MVLTQLYKISKLQLNIVPNTNYDKSVGEEIYELVVCIILLIVLCLIISVMCPCLSDNNGFVSAIPSFEQIYKLKDESNNTKENENPKIIEHFSNSINISNLNFSYSDEKIIDNISIGLIKIPARQGLIN